MKTLKSMIGEYVIVRTCSAGVWAGTLSDKAKNEVILKSARRLWKWRAEKGISLSGLAVYGLDKGYVDCRICVAVPSLWLEAVEIIPVSGVAKASILNAEESHP